MVFESVRSSKISSKSWSSSSSSSSNNSSRGGNKNVSSSSGSSSSSVDVNRIDFINVKTGKRGVPQQFPRRLYEMIETESSSIVGAPSSDESAAPIIRWSISGRAFHILDVDLFSSKVLPKYFRTNKFSSFQRNLNLYGFTKVRRGPDMDMYAHPSFIRGEKEAVAQLRKGRGSLTKTKRRDSPSPPFSNGRGISPLSSVHSIHPTLYSRKISICETDGNLLSKPFTSSSISLRVPLEEHTSCSSSSSSYDETEHFSTKAEPCTNVKNNKLALLTLALSSLADM